MNKAKKDRKHEQAEREKQQEREEDQKRGVSEHNQDLLDEGIEESFPASDPPSVSHID